MWLKYRYECWALLSALLLTLGWPMLPLNFLLFIAWVPWLLLQSAAAQKKLSTTKFYLLTYAMLLLWNIGTTWWVSYASLGGGIAAIVLNALLMSAPLMLFHVTQKKLIGWWWPYLLLIGFWISFEKLHLTWELAWPWLTLGNGFANQIHWIQWYQYTGHLGGSAWIWVCNLLALKAFINYKRHRRIITSLKPILAIGIPIIISSILEFANFNFYKSGINVVVVQPNIDPYNEKFNPDEATNQINKFIALAETKITQNTQYLVLPETAIPRAIWLKQFNNDESITILRNWLKKYPNCKLIVGASLINEYDYEATATSFKLGSSNIYADCYNAAIQMDTSKTWQYYIKSKLVPAAERMPYPSLFKFLSNYMIDLGGTSENLATQDTRTVFKNQHLNIAPVICYESVFGNFVADYFRAGANVIFIITNDGWWHNTPGHQQHLAYASLRAIETQSEVVRSANTGISCFIMPNGQIKQQLPYWTAGAISANIHTNNTPTFYIKYGHVVEDFFYCLALFCLLYWCIQVVVFKNKSAL
jgi:apolipoprotein N-acyltransferase